MSMKYVVYVFLGHRNKPYYVGKTNNFERRKKEHLTCIKAGDQLPKYRMARKLIRQGQSFRMKAIAKTENESHAYAVETFFIKKFRKEGVVLFNLTSGGKREKKIKINIPKKKKIVSKKRGKVNARRKSRKTNSG
jgi:predicted GIY-YIG superfamily endonuclease